ncbi:hypothetical protein [Capybara microvirus Cap3_SP_445]|nr:hypothetical protein [Capybara microvirus Cap3_SP_445]
MKQNPSNCFKARSDGKVFPGEVFSPIVKEYSLIDSVIMIGDTPRDFIIHKTPELINEYDIDKQIAAEAASCDIKSQILAAMQNGSIDSLAWDGSSGAIDATSMPSNLMEAQNIINAGLNAYDSLDPDLKKKGLDFIKNMTQTEFESYIKSLIPSQPIEKDGDING